MGTTSLGNRATSQESEKFLHPDRPEGSPLMMQTRPPGPLTMWNMLGATVAIAGIGIIVWGGWAQSYAVETSSPPSTTPSSGAFFGETLRLLPLATIEQFDTRKVSPPMRNPQRLGSSAKSIAKSG